MAEILGNRRTTGGTMLAQALPVVAKSLALPSGVRQPQRKQFPPPGAKTISEMRRATGCWSPLFALRTEASAATVCNDNQPGQDCTASESAAPGC
jgi:hypothetical protein